MEKQVLNYHHHLLQQQQQNHNSLNTRERHIIGEGLIRPPQSTDFVLRWGSRKRLRCMKIQVKDEPASVHRTTVRVDRRVVRSNDNNNNNNNNNNGSCVVNGGINTSHGHFNLRQRKASPAQLPQRILRVDLLRSPESQRYRNNNNNNTESGSGMKGSNGGMVVGSPERGEKKGSGAHAHQENNKTVSFEKGGGGSSSGGSDVVVWPPKFMIALTNKEKEEDFMAIKGSKLPQRPKKRAKFIQRTLNLVSPGGWLCDLTLDRYEVREKKTTKKRPRGLKAMGNYMDSDSD